ncbi:hypothetical protein MTO96_017961 [Rhipicephalus appendiculatus]
MRRLFAVGNLVTSEAVEEGAGGEPVALLSAVESAGEEEGGVSRPEVEEVLASELVVGEGNDPSMVVSGMLPVLRKGAGEAASAKKGLFPSGSAGTESPKIWRSCESGVGKMAEAEFSTGSAAAPSDEKGPGLVGKAGKGFTGPGVVAARRVRLPGCAGLFLARRGRLRGESCFFPSSSLMRFLASLRRSSNARDRLELALKLGPKGSSAEVLSPIKRCGGRHAVGRRLENEETLLRGEKNKGRNK